MSDALLDEGPIRFYVVPRGVAISTNVRNTVYLRTDSWNDYSFVTMFHVELFDEEGQRYNLNNVRIGFVGQTESTATHERLPKAFTDLPPEFFSLGTDVDYYRLLSGLDRHFASTYLKALRDVVYDPTALDTATHERVFSASHLRTVSLPTISQQFRRVLDGGVLLTDYNFRFTLPPAELQAGFVLDFAVTAHSNPRTNIHAVIGRNGVGKTTILNSMASSIAQPQVSAPGYFERLDWLDQVSKIPADYFSSVISVSFSAFDPFNPPKDQPDPKKGTCYFYVGLKDYADEGGAILKSHRELHAEFVESLKICLSETGKSRRWITAIATLESDDNFAEMRLGRLADLPTELVEEPALALIKSMSSGHAIVLLTLTKLVARVEEKTLVLFDEPESHLHPPLLSALVRSLSQLLFDRNAVAIIATHSPVVLQEVPRSCVWKITRTGQASSVVRPESETFGENVGVLTRDVFGLEVSKSGYNALLAEAAISSSSYEEALAKFEGQLGFEGRAILRSLKRDSSESY